MIINCSIHDLQAQDSCPRCEEDNPYWRRALTVYVDVRDDWLDEDGSGEEGRNFSWDELLMNLTNAIKGVYKGTLNGRLAGAPIFSVEWEGKPEKS